MGKSMGVFVPQDIPQSEVFLMENFLPQFAQGHGWNENFPAHLVHLPSICAPHEDQIRIGFRQRPVPESKRRQFPGNHQVCRVQLFLADDVQVTPPDPVGFGYDWHMFFLSIFSWRRCHRRLICDPNLTTNPDLGFWMSFMGFCLSMAEFLVLFFPECNQTLFVVLILFPILAALPLGLEPVG